MGEGTKWIPDTVAEAKKHPDIMLYQKITSRFPGESDWQVIVDVFDFLRGQHGDGLEAYLVPFWTNWSSRRTRENKPYSSKSRVWYAEWAMTGKIPQANGHEPQLGESGVDDVVNEVVQNAR